MPFSTCFNCGDPLPPPYGDFYCADCNKIKQQARENAIKNGEDAAEAGRKALATRAFSNRSNRPDPRAPFTQADATWGALSSRFSQENNTSL